MTHKRTTVEGIGIDQQLALLLEYGVDPSGCSHTVPSIAQATGIADQTLTNLLNGTTASPRLDTIRGLCQLYGIDLTYFDLQTEAESQQYLINHLGEVYPLIQTIREQIETLSPDSQERVKRIIGWIQANEAQLGK